MATSRRHKAKGRGKGQGKGKGQDKSKYEDEGSKDRNGTAAMAVALSYTVIPSWANSALMVSLIFGGCCSNVCESNWMPVARVEED